MRATMTALLLILLSLPSYGDDIFHATSEDIAEFDKLLEAQPMERPPIAKSKSKSQHRGAKGPSANLPSERRGPPRDDRERGRRNPPPKPPGQGGPPPPIE